MPGMGVDGYIGMTDAEVLAFARDRLNQAMRQPASSTARTREWQRFDSAMLELSRRAMNHVLREIRRLDEQV